MLSNFAELEAANGDSTAVGKCKMLPKDLNTIKTPKFIWKVQKIIDKNLRKSINAITKELKVSRYFIKRSVHEEF